MPAQDPDVITPLFAQIGAGTTVIAATLLSAVFGTWVYGYFREQLPDHARVLIMGSGLVGTEFANDLITNHYQVAVVDMLPLPLAQLVPPAVGESVRDALASEGVEWHLGRKVVAIN